MADIPRIPQVGEIGGAARLPTQDNPLSPSLANTGGRQAAEAAAASASLAAAFSRIQQEQDEVNVLEAENQLRQSIIRLSTDPEEGFQGATGAAVVSRPSGKSLTAEYRERFEAAADAAGARLVNDRQRRLFAERRNAFRSAFEADVSRHELSEFRKHQVSVYSAAVELEKDNLLVVAGQPNVTLAVLRERADAMRARVSAGVAKLGELGSMSANEVEFRKRAVYSDVHRKVVEGLMKTGQTQLAKAYIEEYKQDFLGADLMDIRRRVEEESDNLLAMNVASAVAVGILPSTDPVQANAELDFDRYMNVVYRLENDSGDPRARSSAGAVGVGQMLPSTGPEAAKLAGVEWDERRFYSDPDYQRRLSRAYMSERLRVWGGDVEKAIIAYHSGDGGVKEALREAERSGRPWQEHLKPNAANHLRKFRREWGRPAQAAAPRPAQTLQEGLAAIRTHPELADRPAARQLAEQLFIRDFELRQRDLSRAREDAKLQGLAAVLKGSDPRRLPPELRAAMGPSNLAQLIDYYDARVRQSQQDDPRAILELSDPVRLASLTDEQFLAYSMRLRDGTFNTFARSRGALRAGGLQGKPVDATAVNLEMLNNALRPRLPAIVAATPSIRDKDRQSWEAGVRLTLIDAIRAEQVRLGRPLSQLELEQVVDSTAAMKYGYVDERPILPNRRTVKSFLDVRVSDIPREDRQRLEEQWRQLNPGLPASARPDDATLLRAWRNLQLQRQSTLRSISETQEF